MLRSWLALDEFPGNRAPGQPGFRIRYGRRTRRRFRRGSARRDDVGGPLARASRRNSRRQRGRALLSPHGSHDVDAATRQPVQRGGWRSCRPYRHRRLRSRPARIRRNGDGNRSGCADRRHHVLRLAARRGQVAGVLERLDLTARWPADLSRTVPRRRRIGHRRHRGRPEPADLADRGDCRPGLGCASWCCQSAGPTCQS